MDGENILENKPKAPILFVSGNEAHGVRDTLVKMLKNLLVADAKRRRIIERGGRNGRCNVSINIGENKYEWTQQVA